MPFANQLTRKSHILLRLAGFSRTYSTTCTSHMNTKSRIAVLNPIHFNGSFASCYTKISMPSVNGFRFFCRPELGFDQLGRRSVRVSGGGGSGGKSGGDFGGFGNGGGGSGNTGGNWSFISWYLSLLASYPVMTKAVTSAFLTLVGDIICQVYMSPPPVFQSYVRGSESLQLLIDQVPSPDMKRAFIFTLLGLVLVGPTLHFWYLSLSKIVTTPGASGAFLRLLLDQLLFAPTFIGIFLSALMTLEGRPSDVIPKLRQEWFSSVLANWQLWIPFQFFNFRFVPQQFQVLAANFISLIWNVILSYKAHKEVPAK
ncbi:hypothetical protein OROGR_011501 [Orobanche gracilis]